MAEPIRTCLGCRRRFPKRQLIRFAVSKEGHIAVDVTGKKPGRGAYVCPRLECVEAAMRVKRLQRPLRRPVDEATVAQLKADLVQIIQERDDEENAWVNHPPG